MVVSLFVAIREIAEMDFLKKVFKCMFSFPKKYVYECMFILFFFFFFFSWFSSLSKNEIHWHTHSRASAKEFNSFNWYESHIMSMFFLLETKIREKVGEFCILYVGIAK